MRLVRRRDAQQRDLVNSMELACYFLLFLSRVLGCPFSRMRDILSPFEARPEMDKFVHVRPHCVTRQMKAAEKFLMSDCGSKFTVCG